MSPSSIFVAKPSDYLDFELEVSPSAGGLYPAVITRSPAGQGQAAVRLMFDETALEGFLKEPDQTAVAFGQALFASLFAGDIRRLYAESLAEAALLSKGVRLKVHFQAPELAALPWEYMFSPDLADYVCLSPKTLLARYQAAPKPRWPLLLKTPLRVLGVIASPPGLPALDGEAEKQKLEAALQPLMARGLVSLTWLAGPSWKNLEATLAQSTWNILHVIGHSGFNHERGEDYLILADAAGEPLPLSAAQLGEALSRQASLRLLTLHVYEETQIGHASGLATSLVHQGMPAALVIPYVSQHAAPVFAAQVYEALAHSGAVDIAVKAARDRVRQTGAGIVAWGLPALSMQAADGLLFDVLSPAQTQFTERVEAAPVPQRTELNYLLEELAERETQVQAANENLAQLKIEIARLAGEQAERGYQVLDSAKRLTAIKTELVRLAGEQAERERQVEAVTQRLLMLLTEAERLAKEQAERERQVQAATEQMARLTSAQAENERQLQQAAAQLEKLHVEVARLTGEQAECERQAETARERLGAVTADLGRLNAERAEAERQTAAAQGALAAMTAEVERLTSQQVESERQVQERAERLAALQAAVKAAEAEQAERAGQVEQRTAQAKALEGDVRRLTQQAAEQAHLAQQETEHVEALRAEAQRLTVTVRANWARARRRYLWMGAAGGMALMAVIAVVVFELSRLVH